MKALWQNISSYWEGIYKLEHPVREEWATPNKVVLEQGNLRLRHFTNSDVEEHRPVLILPPQAGHHSNLADYASDQSLVRVFQRYGFDVFVAEWRSATFEQRNLNFDDLFYLTDMAVEKIRSLTGVFKIHIVGQCQGGWQAAIYTSLYPEKIASLTAAAAPIDLSAAHSPINDYARLPMAFFEYLVAIGNGLMDGKYMLLGFKNMQPQEHYVRKYYDMWNMIESDDQARLDRFFRFQNWYGYTQKLPGQLYLDIIKNIFKENNLTKPGSFSVRGIPVDLRNISCPVVILAGKKDHITPPAQAFALKDLIGTPPSDVVEILTSGGHIGTLMGHQALTKNWTTVNEMLEMVI